MGRTSLAPRRPSRVLATLGKSHPSRGRGTPETWQPRELLFSRVLRPPALLSQGLATEKTRTRTRARRPRIEPGRPRCAIGQACPPASSDGQPPAEVRAPKARDRARARRALGAHAHRDHPRNRPDDRDPRSDRVPRRRVPPLLRELWQRVWGRAQGLSRARRPRPARAGRREGRPRLRQDRRGARSRADRRLGGQPPWPRAAGLPAPRPDSCDACERPLERHQVVFFELRGTPVLGLCGSCSPVRRSAR